MFASRQKNTYVPTNQIWLNRLFFQISNSQEKTCLTVDTRNINDFGPGKFKTRADNAQEQHCYFNRSNTDSRFKCFLAKRVESEQDRPVFSVTKQNYYCLTTEPYKSTGVQTSQATATVDGRVNETVEQTDRKNNHDRSKTKRGGGRDGSVDATEPTSSLGQRLQFDKRGDKNDQETVVGEGEAEKKPRFLSN